MRGCDPPKEGSQERERERSKEQQMDTWYQGGKKIFIQYFQRKRKTIDCDTKQMKEQNTHKHK